jgi:hypothetical protein
VVPPIIKLDSRTHHEVSHGPRYEDFARLCQRLDPRCNVDPEPRNVVSTQLNLACVDARPYADAKGLSAIANSLSAPHRSGRPIEGGKYSIARLLDEPTAVSSDLTFSQGVVSVE